VLGHRHHDHLICTECGRIEEFHEERIEDLQVEIAKARGFELTSHDLRLMGVCAKCQRSRTVAKS
jgi:Fur family transcriptional regulator, ferric uptake regulator